MPSAHLARGAVINLAGRIAVMGGGLLLIGLVARLGTEAQGAFALLTAVEAVLMALFSGFGLALARVHSRGEGAVVEPRLQATMLAAAMGVGAVAAVPLLAVSLIAQGPPYSLLWIMAITAPWILWVPTATGAWLGQGRLVAMNVCLASAPVAVPLAVIAWQAWGAGPTVLAVMALWVGTKSAAGALSAAICWREAGWTRPAMALLRPQLGFVAALGATNVVGLLNYRINLFLVERLQGLSAAGVYSVAVSAAELLWFVSSAITMASYKRIGVADGRAAAATTVQAMRWSVVGVLAGMPLLLGVAWWVLPNGLGAAYAASWWPLALLMPGTLAYCVASAVSAYFTNHLGRPQLAGRIAGLSLASNVVCSLVLVPRFGIHGAAVATSVSYSLAIAVGIAVFLKAARLPARALWARHTA